MKLSEALNRVKPAKTIRSSSKGITEIDVIKPSFEIITELFLQDNRLTSLKHISQFPNLNRIAIENNLLSDIEELQELRLLPKLREIRLKGNPIVNIPLFHEQIANICKDYIIIDSKIVKFGNNKAKYENNIIFSLYLINFIKSIQKKPDIDTLSKKLDYYYKKNNYVQFSHKIRYSHLKSDEKTYFYTLRTLCSQKINEKCQNHKNFETLACFIIQIIQSKLSYLNLRDLKKLNLPFFDNVSMDKPNYQISPYCDVNIFYTSSFFGNTEIIHRDNLPQHSSVSTIPSASEYLSLVSFDFESSDKIDNMSNNISASTKRSESSIRRALIKNDSKNYLSLPAIESDFSTVPCHRDIGFSEPFKVSMNSSHRSDTLSIETSAEFSLIEPPEPPQQLLCDDQLLEFLNTQSSSSPVTTPRQKTAEAPLSQSSSSSSPQPNSPIIPSRQNSSFISDDVDSLTADIDETLAPQKRKNQSAYSNSNSPVRKRRRSSLKNDYRSNENTYTVNSNGVKSDTDSTFTFETEDLPVIPSLLNENDKSSKKRKRVRRKKVTFQEDSVSEAFLAE